MAHARRRRQTLRGDDPASSVDAGRHRHRQRCSSSPPASPSLPSPAIPPPVKQNLPCHVRTPNPNGLEGLLSIPLRLSLHRRFALIPKIPLSIVGFYLVESLPAPPFIRLCIYKRLNPESAPGFGFSKFFFFFYKNNNNALKV